MTNDPVIRYVAAAILLVTFCAALAVVVHGFWTDSHYQIPNLLNYVLASAVSSALTLLGVHIGSQSAQVGVSTGAQVAKEATANGVQAASQAPH